MKGLVKSAILIWLFCVVSIGSYACTPSLMYYVLSEHGMQLNSAVKMDKITIKFKPNTSLAEIQQVLESGGMSVLFQVPWPAVSYVQLNRPDTSYYQLHERLKVIEKNRCVEYASPILETVDKSGFAVLNEAFVKLKKGYTIDYLEHKAAGFNFKVKEKYPYMDDVYVITYQAPVSQNTWDVDGLQNILDVCLAMKSLLGNQIEYAEPDYLFNPIVATNDALYSRQWPIHNDSTTTFQGGIHGTIGASMHVDSAWTITQGDSNIHIAVIDAGVDTLHPDLVGNLLPGYDATGQGSKGYPNINKRENGHGTSCTGIIVAKGDDSIGVVGVAPLCKVLPIRVFYYIDSLGQTNIPWSRSIWMADAIGYAWHTGNVDVMSNSWAVPDLLFSLIGDSNSINLVSDIIDQAHTQGRNGKGIPMFFSSGNWDSTQTAVAPVPLWPGRLHAAIAVNATSMCDELKSYNSCDHEQWMGHHGDSLKISAPGVQVPTCDMTGNLGYNNTNYTTTFNGTSAACPNAAGVMALILSARPDLRWADAVKIMYQTADTVGGYNYDTIKEWGHWSNELGYGRVNAFRAVTTAQSFVGVAENVVPNDNGLSVYPNPAQSVLNISFSITDVNDITIQLFSANGQLILQQQKGKLAAGKHTETMELNNSFPTGFYFGRVIQSDGQSTAFKFVIAK